MVAGAAGQMAEGLGEGNIGLWCRKMGGEEDDVLAIMPEIGGLYAGHQFFFQNTNTFTKRSFFELCMKIVHFLFVPFALRIRRRMCAL